MKTALLAAAAAMLLLPTGSAGARPAPRAGRALLQQAAPPGGCADLLPSNGDTCEDVKRWGMCDDAWLRRRENACARTCGACAGAAQPGPAASAPQEERQEPTARSAAKDLATTALTLPARLVGATFSGDGTAFSDAVDGAAGGAASFACSLRWLGAAYSQRFAAVNAAQWEDGAACGRCALARCVDDFCTPGARPTVVKIVDLCPECREGDLDFSFPAYREITGRWPHRLRVEWEWVDCKYEEVAGGGGAAKDGGGAAEAAGTIRLDPKEGSNAYFQAFYLSRSAFPIDHVELDGRRLERSPFQFYVVRAADGRPLPEGRPMQLKVVAQNGAAVEATVTTLAKAQDLNVQFSLAR